jgi:hypothetical protein
MTEKHGLAFLPGAVCTSSHFSPNGKNSFVRIVKTHLNPILGMKPYSEYVRSQNPGRRTPGIRQTRGKPGQPQNNKRLQGQKQNNYKPGELLKELAKLLN